MFIHSKTTIVFYFDILEGWRKYSALFTNNAKFCYDILWLILKSPDKNPGFNQNHENH